MKKITFLVPAYKGLNGLQKNRDFGLEIVKHANVIVVEDSLDKTMEEFCVELGIEYFSKPNGNGGSVVNFALLNKIVKTEGMAIVDVDDTIDVEEFLILEKKLDSNLDVVFSRYKTIDYLNEKNVKIDNWIGVHSSGFKTKLFYELSPFPEDVFFTDNFLMLKLLDKKNKSIKIEESPYNYFVNVPGQSVNNNSIELFMGKVSSFTSVGEHTDDFLAKNKITIERHFKNRIKKMKNYLFCEIRIHYDKSVNKEFLAFLRDLYKKEKKRNYPPIEYGLIWSKLFRLFSFKSFKKSI